MTENKIRVSKILEGIIIAVLGGIILYFITEKYLNSNPKIKDITNNNLLKSEMSENFEGNNGLFKDDVHNQIYKWVRFGNQIWMAENLAVIPNIGNYWVCDNDIRNIKRYGNLYDWKTALDIKIKGWHLPTEEEWLTLYYYIGGGNERVYNVLMERSDIGFNALYGGCKRFEGSYNAKELSPEFWTASEHSPNYAWSFWCNHAAGVAHLRVTSKNSGISVRLIHD